MKKMDLIFEKFASDKALLEKFLENTTLEDMYSFCLSIDKDLTKKEFDEFASDAIESFGSEVEKTINEEDLNQISGGAHLPQGVLSKSKKEEVVQFVLKKYNN